MESRFISENLPRPSLVVHADWSLNHRKRWMAKAGLDASGNYFVESLENVGDARTLLARLRTTAGDRGCVLVGFDFPIGLPLAYAQKCGIVDFVDFLSSGIESVWPEFFTVARWPDEISLRRPFYPYRPGHSRQSHLLNA